MNDTKKKLASAAVRLWSEKGYRNASVNEICAECGVTKGSFYHHFDSKESLLFYYYNEVLADEYSGNIAAVDGLTSDIGAIKQVYRMFADALLTLKPDMIMAFLSRTEDYNVITLTMDEDSASYRCFRVIRERIAHGKETGEITSDCSTEDLINLGINATLGNLVAWCYSKRKSDLTQQNDMILERILRK